MATEDVGKHDDEFLFLKNDPEFRNERLLFTEFVQEEDLDDYAASLLRESIEEISFSGAAAFLSENSVHAEETVDTTGTAYLFESETRGRALPARFLGLERLEELSSNIEQENDMGPGALEEPIRSFREKNQTLVYLSDTYSFQDFAFRISEVRATWDAGNYPSSPHDEVVVLETDTEPCFSAERGRMELNGVAIKSYDEVAGFEKGVKDLEHSMSRYLYGIDKE